MPYHAAGCIGPARGRLGLSLSDILGTVSNVAGDLGAGASGDGSASYYGAPPSSSYYATPAPASTGVSGTTLLLGALAVGAVAYFAFGKH